MARVLGIVLLALGLLKQTESFKWDIPAPFPRPSVPADNRMSSAKVELGRYLFYDKRMSVNGTQSCASCHRQELAFTDGRAQAEGATGELHSRSSMSLANVAYNASLTWMNASLRSLESQAEIPMFGITPVELGLKGNEDRFLTMLKGDNVYRGLFPQSFPEDNDPYTMRNVTKAIAAFERTLVSMNAPYDRYRYEDQSDAISDAAKRGEILFYSGEKGGCFQCHGSWNLNNSIQYEGGPTPRVILQGEFRVPTLRNISVTAPYMHDGSISTLSGVIDFYRTFGRASRRARLNDDEKKDLIAFLESLTDSEFLRNPSFSDPRK